VDIPQDVYHLAIRNHVRSLKFDVAAKLERQHESTYGLAPAALALALLRAQEWFRAVFMLDPSSALMTSLQSLDPDSVLLTCAVTCFVVTNCADDDAEAASTTLRQRFLSLLIGFVFTELNAS